MIITAQVTPSATRRVMHRSYVLALCDRALANGGQRKSLFHVHWDISSQCERPNYLEIEGRLAPLKNAGHPDMDIVIHDNGLFYFRDFAPGTTPLTLTMEVKCRRCPKCLSDRAHHWRMRAMHEINVAPRSWFGTLTLSAEQQQRATWQAEYDLGKGGTRFYDLSPDERFSETIRVIGKDVTKWLKRIRKESKAALRYFLVAEAHKSGLPHLHILIHEKFDSLPVGERTLRGQWHLGYSKFNLVNDPRAAAYVCKYLSKSMNARIRASIDYGKAESVSFKL